MQSIISRKGPSSSQAIDSLPMKVLKAGLQLKRSLRSSNLRRSSRWLPSLALMLAMPKCLACIVAYASVTAFVGGRFANLELCGGGPRFDWTWIALAAGLSFLQIGLFPNRRSGLRRWQKVKPEMATKNSETQCY